MGGLFSSDSNRSDSSRAAPSVRPNDYSYQYQNVERARPATEQFSNYSARGEGVPSQVTSSRYGANGNYDIGGTGTLRGFSTNGYSYQNGEWTRQTTGQFTNNYGGERIQSQVVNSGIASDSDYYLDQVTRSLRHINIAGCPSRQIQGPQRSTRNFQLFNLFDTIRDFSATISYVPLTTFDTEYLVITRMITNKRNFKVDSIEKIINPFLEKAYELKKAQKKNEFPNFEELLLFHGTKRAHVKEICEQNFNWRMCKTHKYGKGISFSPNSTYASNYSDENVYNKVMLVAKVMIGQSCIGNKNMVLPLFGCDTSQKGNDRIVIVKYEDNEFYPVYKINYHLMNQSVGKKPRYQNKRGGMGYNRSPQQKMPVCYGDYDDYFDDDLMEYNY